MQAHTVLRNSGMRVSVNGDRVSCEEFSFCLLNYLFCGLNQPKVTTFDEAHGGGRQETPISIGLTTHLTVEHHLHLIISKPSPNNKRVYLNAACACQVLSKNALI
jgi:hypothetical protein